MLFFGQKLGSAAQKYVFTTIDNLPSNRIKYKILCGQGGAVSKASFAEGGASSQIADFRELGL